MDSPTGLNFVSSALVRDDGFVSAVFVRSIAVRVSEADAGVIEPIVCFQSPIPFE
jgi:hypothetical protein